MPVYKGLETSTSLLIAYETLALAHKKTYERQEFIVDGETHPEAANKKINNYVNYNHAFSLLVINASIIEGTLRSILSQYVIDDIESATDKGLRAGQTAPSKPEQLLMKFHSDIEMQGGWEKLKEQYAFYFDISLDKIMPEDVKEAVNTIFVLRNVLAHGTAIIHPKVKMDDSMQDVYPYNWQRKLQRASVYLEKNFKKGDIFENLADFSMPEHFIEITKQFFAIIEKQFSPVPSRAAKTIEMLKPYSFGYLFYSR